MPVIDFEVACVRCGASLREVALDGICPHCHLDIGSTLYLPAIDQGPMTVGRDVPCGKCGYDLRTLALGSVCPECGSAVAPSLAPVSLGLADPNWLCEQRGMATMALAGMLVPPICGCGLGALVWVFDEPVAAAFILLLLAVFSIPSLLVGTWGLCACGQYRSHPTYVRLLPIIYATLLLAVAFLLVTGALEAPLLATQIMGTLLSCLVGMLVCTTLSVRYLGERAQSRGLRRLATVWAGCLVALMAFILAGSLILASTAGIPIPIVNPWWERPAEAVVAVTAGAAYVLGVATIGSCRDVLSDVIKRQEREARTIGQDGTKGHRDKGETVCR